MEQDVEQEGFNAKAQRSRNGAKGIRISFFASLAHHCVFAFFWEGPKKNWARPAPQPWELSSQRAGLATGALYRHGAPPNIDAPFRNASDPKSSPERWYCKRSARPHAASRIEIG